MRFFGKANFNMDLFYTHPDNISDSIITLDDFEAKHLLKTLRKKVGDSIDITDGNGKHFFGKIITIKPKLTVEINSQETYHPDNKNITLAIGFIRPNRLEFVLEKCTELGVNSFYIYRNEYANYFSDNKERFEKILRQAIKQSNRFFLPELHLVNKFDQFIDRTKDIAHKLAAIDPKSPPIKSFIQQTSDSVLFCVGPEGGFSNKEVTLLKENNFQDVSLGNYRLRAETAAIAGISYLNLLHS